MVILTSSTRGVADLREAARANNTVAVSNIVTTVASGCSIWSGRSPAFEHAASGVVSRVVHTDHVTGVLLNVEVVLAVRTGCRRGHQVAGCVIQVDGGANNRCFVRILYAVAIDVEPYVVSNFERCCVAQGFDITKTRCLADRAGRQTSCVDSPAEETNGFYRPTRFIVDRDDASAEDTPWNECICGVRAGGVQQVGIHLSQTTVQNFGV